MGYICACCGAVIPLPNKKEDVKKHIEAAHWCSCCERRDTGCPYRGFVLELIAEGRIKVA